MNPLAQVLKEQPNLFHEYQKTVLMVREFRREHLLLVETYIHKPAARAGKWQETVGTGGTPFKSYLANRYHATQVTPAELAMEACG